MKKGDFTKKSLLLIAMLLLSVTFVHAREKGDMAAGLNLACGINGTLTNFGIGAKYQWNITNAIRLEPSFDFYFPKDLYAAKYNMWDINVNGHWLFTIKDKFILYPLFGLTLLNTTLKYKSEYYGGWLDEVGVGRKHSAANFGVNIGGGAEYPVTEAISLNLEIKYQIVANGWSRALFTLGAAYKF